jgi:hypothetical protein
MPGTAPFWKKTINNEASKLICVMLYTQKFLSVFLINLLIQYIHLTCKYKELYNNLKIA